MAVVALVVAGVALLVLDTYRFRLSRRRPESPADPFDVAKIEEGGEW